MIKVKEVCKQKLQPIIEQNGYELVDVEYKKEANGMNLIFTIDCDNGVTIDDCERIHKIIDPILDEINPTEDKPYILSVSSPGIDRPLKSERDFKRNIGNEIEISLFKKIDGKKNFVGTLESFDKQQIVIKNQDGQVKLDRSQIAHIVPVIKF